MNQVENSNLNYLISRTPFSANISVKRSLIKFHHDESPKKEDLVANVKEETQTKENQELKSKVVNVLEQNEMLQDLLRQKSDKVEALECELVNLRKKLLRETKEKNALDLKNTTQNKELSNVKNTS